MKIKSNTRWGLIILLILAVLFLALIIVFGYRYMVMRVQSHAPTPLVMIHNPSSYRTIQDGIGVQVHATARSDDGISRIELWVDGDYVFGEESSEGETISPMVLHTTWTPKGTGSHELIVRAYDGKGFEGIGSIQVKANESSEEMPVIGADPFAEDTAAEEEPVSHAPGGSAPSSGGDGGSANPGDSGGSTAPSDGGTGSPPRDDESPESANPGTELGLMEFLFGGVTLFDMGSDDGPPEGSNDTIMLTFEALGLQTDSAYDEVHCYVGIGFGTPRWYPDTDWDQSTDEYFMMVDDRMWNIDEYLSGDKARHLSWPRTEPINISINCMATARGSTVAVDLGMAEINAYPDEWDGITRTVDGSFEGEFELAYRIGQSELVQKILNPDIPSPFNLRINDRRNELEWDWEDPDPTAYPGEVVGYLVYLNETLVFEVSGQDTKAVRLPYSWFFPPCDVEYAFTVAAYTAADTYPNLIGDWSEPSESLFVTHEPDALGGGCETQFWVEFLTLHTGDTPADDRPNNWIGAIGPVSGSFWANGETTIFQGYDITPNRSYGLAEMTIESARLSNRILITPTPGEIITVDFDLGEYQGWDGFNDFCHGIRDIHNYDDLLTLGFYEGTLISEEGRGERCQVDYVIYPLDGTPMGSSADSMPLPWLDIIAVRQQPDTGFVEWDIRNTGSGSWANQNLLIQFTETDSGSAGPSYNVLELFAGVGQTLTIVSDQIVDSVWDYCFILDPRGEVLELYEHIGRADHSTMRYCLPRPDLSIEDVQYNYSDNTLKIHLFNNGEEETDLGSSAVDLADVLVQMNLVEPVPGGYTEISSGYNAFEGVIPPGRGVWLDWSLVSEVREAMRHGYTVLIDPLHEITETNEMNNAYQVPAGRNIRVVWAGGLFSWYPDNTGGCWTGMGMSQHDFSVDISVFAESGHSNRPIVTWHYDGEILSSPFTLLPSEGWDYSAYTTDFWIEGEEQIRVTVEGVQDGWAMGNTTEFFYPSDSWDLLYSDPIPSGSGCLPEDARSGGDEIILVPPFTSWSDSCGVWRVYLNRCETIP